MLSITKKYHTNLYASKIQIQTKITAVDTSNVLKVAINEILLYYKMWNPKKITGDNGIVLKDTGKAFQKELSKLFT